MDYHTEFKHIVIGNLYRFKHYYLSEKDFIGLVLKKLESKTIIVYNLKQKQVQDQLVYRVKPSYFITELKEE